MDIASLLAAAVILLLLLLVTCFLWIVMKTAQTHAKYRHIPGPKRASFFLGNAGQIAALSRSDQDSLVRPKGVDKLKPLQSELFTLWHNDYGDTYVLYLMQSAMVISRSPDAVKMVLAESNVTLFSRTDRLPFRYIFGERFLGDALSVTLDDAQWVRNRKIHDPLYRRKRLRDQIDTVNQTVDQFLEQVGAFAETGETFELGAELHKMTLNISMRIMFSIESCDLNDNFAQAVFKLSNEAWDGSEMARMPFISWNPYFHNYRNKIRNSLRQFRALGDKLIQQRLTLVKTDDNPPPDLLTALIKAHIEDASVYSYEELIDEFCLLIIAGMDTTANTISLLLMTLIKHPQLHERLLAEIDEIAGRKTFVSNDDVANLHFTTTMIKETLRFYCPVSILIRETKQEVNFGGYTLPKNSLAMINLHGVCNHPEYVADQDKFDPDRFDVEKTHSTLPTYCNIPFSIGPRNCIGQHLATMGMKVFLAKFFQNYRITPGNSEKFELGKRVLVRPLSNLRCTISWRD